MAQAFRLVGPLNQGVPVVVLAGEARGTCRIVHVEDRTRQVARRLRHDPATATLRQHLILPNCLGAYKPCTLFDPENIEFNRIETDEINRELIDRNMALYLTIPIQQPEGQFIDRMSDVASYFIKRVYAEFIDRGNVDRVKREIILFFEGYNSISEKIGTAHLQELYPHGITLDLQMLLTFWIYKFTALSSEQEDAWNEDCIRFTYFILLKKPFLLF